MNPTCIPNALDLADSKAEREKIAGIVDNISAHCRRLSERCACLMNQPDICSFDLAQIADSCEVVCVQVNKARANVDKCKVRMVNQVSALTRSLWNSERFDEFQVKQTFSQISLYSAALETLREFKERLNKIERAYQTVIEEISNVSGRIGNSCR